MTLSMQERIVQKLAQGLLPSRLDVVNESHLHAGHAGDDGSGETHFHVTVASSLFEGKGRIERQRIVYDLLKDEMAHGVHALSVKTFTGDEYD